MPICINMKIEKGNTEWGNLYKGRNWIGRVIGPVCISTKIEKAIHNRAICIKGLEGAGH